MANAGIVNRDDFRAAMEPTLNEVFMKGYNLGGEQYSQVFDVRDSYKRQEEILEIVGPSEVEESNEGGMYQRVTIQSGRSKTFLHTTFKAEIKITEEMIEDNQYPIIVQAAKMLGIAFKRTVEKRAANFFINGLSGGELTPDGKAVFATDHPVLDPEGDNPTTFSNKITTPFGSPAVKALRTLMRKQRDEHGDLAPFIMDQLIVNPDLEWVAGELMESNKLYDTANNAENTVRRGLKLIVLDHLADAPANAATMFFGRDSGMAKNIFWWRRRPRTGFINEEASGDPIWRISGRFSIGAASPQGLAASDGSDT